MNKLHISSTVINYIIAKIRQPSTTMNSYVLAGKRDIVILRCPVRSRTVDKSVRGNKNTRLQPAE